MWRVLVRISYDPDPVISPARLVTALDRSHNQVGATAMPSHAIPPSRDRRLHSRRSLGRDLSNIWRNLPRLALLFTAFQVAGPTLPGRGSAVSQLLHMAGWVLVSALLVVLMVVVLLSLPVRIRRWARDYADPRPRWQYALAGLCLLGIAACIALLSLHQGSGLASRLSGAAFVWSGLYGLLQLGRAACRGRARALLWWPPLAAKGRTARTT